MRFAHFGIQMAVRNVLRHGRRSASAVSAVAFGVVSLLLASGFIESILVGMRESTITSQLGHIQVSRRTSTDSGAARPFQDLLPDGSPVLAAIASRADVRAAGRRIRFSGMLSLGENTISFIGEGVDPDQEALLSASLQITQGQNLSASDPRGIILGAGLAANLGAAVGDPVVLMANTAAGGVNAIEGRVRGTFTSVSKAYDDAALRVPIVAANELLKVAGSHTWVVLLDRTDRTPTALEAVRAEFAGQPLQFVPWHALADMYNKTAVLFTRQVNVVKFIVAAIIVLSISNTMMMVVLERTGEIGTAMALGLRRRRIMRQFLVEGALLGILGGATGLALGMLLAALISHVGIPMPPPPGMARGYTAQIAVSGVLVSESLLLAVATALAASVYPAWKASRMAIVDSLRHNR
jgi:putative ABC transport system permease protein